MKFLVNQALNNHIYDNLITITSNNVYQLAASAKSISTAPTPVFVTIM